VNKFLVISGNGLFCGFIRLGLGGIYVGINYGDFFFRVGGGRIRYDRINKNLKHKIQVFGVQCKL
jgi:hypothetical protein